MTKAKTRSKQPKTSPKWRATSFPSWKVISVREMPRTITVGVDPAGPHAHAFYEVTEERKMPMLGMELRTRIIRGATLYPTADTPLGLHEAMRALYALISFVNNACETHDRQTGHFPSIGRRMP